MTSYDERGWRAETQTWLVERSRGHKRLMLGAADFMAVLVALWAAMSLRYGQPHLPESAAQAALMIAAPVLVVASLAWFGIYKLVTRFVGYRGLSQLVLAVVLGVLVWSLLVFMSGQIGIPRSVILPTAVVSALAIAGLRQAIGGILRSTSIAMPLFREARQKKSVIIFGAGETGMRLLAELRRSIDREAVAFVDSSPSVWGQYAGGLKIHRPEKIGGLVDRLSVSEIIIAIPGKNWRERRAVIQNLESYSVEVKILPGYDDIASGRVGAAGLRPVDVGDLLGRDPVAPNTELLARNTKGKSILVTGAGGSIGSELVRQILKQAPRGLVLFDLSEAALYEIEIEVIEYLDREVEASRRPTITAVVGSVLDRPLVTEVIRSHGIQTIYHAAAYKHVPIVEFNVVSGLSNNTVGAQTVADVARELGVERMIFISTDKAVRPTNVVGASKRLAELILQAMAANSARTVFAIVRFGNVLGSSGSVVPRFKKQIEAGGPVTVTHPNIERYFMSIPEAAELVLQAGAMALGGEVFVLHMGDPVKIYDLARLMVHLSGLEVRDGANPEGDIEIVYTGLRPGEKLYEELLIGTNGSGTEHPRILKSEEPFLPEGELVLELDQLYAAIEKRDVQAIEAMLTRLVEGYKAEGGTSGEPSGASAQTHWSTQSRTLH